MTAGDTVVRDPRKPRDFQVLTVDTGEWRVVSAEADLAGRGRILVEATDPEKVDQYGSSLRMLVWAHLMVTTEERLARELME